MKIPVLKPKTVLPILRSAGFFIDHQTGSHLILLNGQGRRVTIAMHNRDLKRKTFRSILRQAGLTLEEFLKLMRKR